MSALWGLQNATPNDPGWCNVLGVGCGSPGVVLNVVRSVSDPHSGGILGLDTDDARSPETGFGGNESPQARETARRRTRRPNKHVPVHQKT
eukprot:2813390-Prymnesium_polylepis.1